MSTTLLVLFQITSFFFDINMLLKVVGMLFIYSFVRSHVQHPILSLVLIIGLCAFLLFDFWTIFGSALILYLLAIFGVLHILVDLSFMHAFTKPLFNIGGMFAGKRPTPPPQMQQGGPEYEQHAGKRYEEGEEEMERGGPEHQGDRGLHHQMTRNELLQRQRAEYARQRRGGNQERGRDDERRR